MRAQEEALLLLGCAITLCNKSTQQRSREKAHMRTHTDLAHVPCPRGLRPMQ